jgi:hypothetical protein
MRTYSCLIGVCLGVALLTAGCSSGSLTVVDNASDSGSAADTSAPDAPDALDATRDTGVGPRTCPPPDEVGSGVACTLQNLSCPMPGCSPGTNGSLCTCGNGVWNCAAQITCPSEAGADSSLDGGMCVIVSSTYDHSCSVDNDCVAVEPGGNVCDPCHSGSGDFVCPLDALNANVASDYLGVLGAGLATIPANLYQMCVISSCPTFGVALCQSGTCTIGNPRDGGDGG